MGTLSRSVYAPKRLPEKLLQIRKALYLTQEEMLKKLGDEFSGLQQSVISRYESGLREPPLLVLLRYAELANVYVDALLRDDIDLPAKLPTQTKSL